MNLLEISHLRKNFATQIAVDDISFEIEKGTVFGLLGPNGAGKTTLIRMITGIFYPDGGEILYHGKKFNPEDDYRTIGYMPEERGLYKKMKIGEQAVYLAQLKGLSKAEATEKAKEWFTRFEMQSWWNKKVEDLSKGMGQKLQFVITVLHNPSLIILDEPFSGLDPVNSNLIKEEIFNLARQGATVIFSTHRMEQVEEICDKIILVNKGKKILDGAVKAVQQAHKRHLFEVSFEKLPEIPASEIFEVTDTNKNALIVKLREGHSSNQMLQYFLNRHETITSFREILPTLNEIFIKLVEGTPMARQFTIVNT